MENARDVAVHLLSVYYKCDSKEKLAGLLAGECAAYMIDGDCEKLEGEITLESGAVRKFIVTVVDPEKN